MYIGYEGKRSQHSIRYQLGHIPELVSDVPSGERAFVQVFEEAVGIFFAIVTPIRVVQILGGQKASHTLQLALQNVLRLKRSRLLH